MYQTKPTALALDHEKEKWLFHRLRVIATVEFKVGSRLLPLGILRDHINHCRTCPTNHDRISLLSPCTPRSPTILSHPESRASVQQHSSRSFFSGTSLCLYVVELVLLIAPRARRLVTAYSPHHDQADSIRTHGLYSVICKNPQII